MSNHATGHISKDLIKGSIIRPAFVRNWNELILEIPMSSSEFKKCHEAFYKRSFKEGFTGGGGERKFIVGNQKMSRSEAIEHVIQSLAFKDSLKSNREYGLKKGGSIDYPKRKEIENELRKQNVDGVPSISGHINYLKKHFKFIQCGLLACYPETPSLEWLRTLG